MSPDAESDKGNMTIGDLGQHVVRPLRGLRTASPYCCRLRTPTQSMALIAGGTTKTRAILQMPLLSEFRPISAAIKHAAFINIQRQNQTSGATFAYLRYSQSAPKVSGQVSQ